jgi:hypothetical protein
MKAGRIWLLPLLTLGLLVVPSASPVAGQLVAPASQYATPLLALVPQRNPNPPYGTIDVDVEVGGVLDLGAFQMDVLFDSAFVQVEGVRVAPFLGQVAGCDPNLARCAVLLGPALDAGRVRYGAATYGAPAGAGGEGVVAVLHLRSTGAVGTTMLTIENAVLADIHAVPIVHDTQGATLIIQHGIYLPLVMRN